MVNPALNQLAGTGWLAGDELKNFISRLVFKTQGFKHNRLCPQRGALGKIFPLPGSTRRQLIHSLRSFGSFCPEGIPVGDQAKMNNIHP
jgi:hypothetical protein